MSFFGSRLRRLEAAARKGPCPECGLAPESRVRIVISTEWMPEDPDERCEACGRWLWLVIKIVYDDEGEASEDFIEVANRGEG